MSLRTRRTGVGRACAAALSVILGSAWVLTPQVSAQLLGSLIVTMTSPGSGSNVSGTIPVSASVTIVGALTVQSVQFKLDGANLGAADTTAPYSVSWNTRTASNGSHTLTAVARDLLGLTWNASPVTVTVFNDTTPPTVALTSPFPGTAVKATVAVNANASDNVGVVGVQFRLDGANLGAEDTTSPYGVSWNTTGATNGSHTLTAVARDAAGNTATSSGVTVTVDNTPPSVSINQAAGQADPTSTSPIHFTAVFGEAVSGFTGADVTIGGSAGGTKTVAVTGGPSTYDVAVSGMTAGTLVASIAAGVATDTAGNGNTASTSTDNTVTFAVADTTPPTVAVTSPASGATVSGTVSVTATASDNIGVAGVRMFVDGVALGAEDTSAPYSATWDTTSTTDGSHTLTATARDGAGHTATSAPVTVTVSNAAPPATSSMRFENTDLPITYTDGITAPGQPAGWWHGSRSRAWSAGTASFNRSDTARARFAFAGTTVRWISFRGPWAGIARVHVDDVFVEEVDLYAATEQVQAVVFSRTGLTAGAHSLTVESTGRKNAASGDYAVVVDAFEVAPASPLPTIGTRMEETGLSRTGAWATDSQTTRAWSGGAAAVSSTAGAQATATIIGTEVSWIGLRGSESGIARVSLDGSFQAEVDLFAPTEAHAVVFMATGLAAGRHTLRIDVTGGRNGASTGAAIVVDAVDVRARVEDPDPSVAYTGDWIRENFARAWSGTSPNAGSGSAALSRTAGAQATVSFTGTQASWIGLRAPWTGTARVLVDGAFLSEVDTYSATEQIQRVLYTATGLSDGPHTLTIEATGLRNPSSTDSLIVVDAFDLTLSSSPPAITRFQETPPGTTYTGAWTQGTRFNLWSGETAAFSATSGAQAAFTFTGTAVRWISQRAFNGGIARVLLDGVEVAQVDTFAPVQEEYQAALFTATGLPSTSHTLTIQVTGLKNPLSQDVFIYVDAFDVH
jgi:Bacterial Ig domain